MPAMVSAQPPAASAVTRIYAPRTRKERLKENFTITLFFLFLGFIKKVMPNNT